MAERHQAVQKHTPFDFGGGREHCGLGESRFVAFHVHLFEIWTPSSNVAFGVMSSWSTGTLGDVVHHRPIKKVTPTSTQEWSIQEKNGGNLACGVV